MSLAELAQRWSLRLRLLLFFLAIGVGGIGLIGLGLWLGFSRSAGDPGSGFLIAGIAAGFGLFGLVAGIWLLFDENVAKPIERLSVDLRARTLAGVEERLDPQPARYLGDLGEAATNLAAELAQARGTLARAVASETERIAAENFRLTSILHDVPAGVILCTGTHRIVLYSAQAVPLLGDAGAVGLDRKIFGLLREEPIRLAHERLSRSEDPDKSIDLLCATLDGKRVLHSQMRLVSSDMPGAPGYVLTLRDVTPDLEAHIRRERMLREIVARLREATTTLNSLLDQPQGADLASVSQEIERLGQWAEALSAGLDTGRGSWWSLAPVDAGEIAEAIRQMTGLDAMTVTAEPLELHCDAYAITCLIAGAVRHIQPHTQPPSLVIRREEQMGVIELGFDGPPPSEAELEEWLSQRLSEGYGLVTARDALDHHGSELELESSANGRSVLRLTIPLFQPERAPLPAEPRPEFFDFDLLDQDVTGVDADCPLDALNYIVFDTETTGLFPDRGDEIVQLSAFRIVNGRLLTGETFDTLVHPGRAIPAKSTGIHGITDAMVADAPDIAEASRRFHQFAQDAVLVAHNAPFDMAFLRRHEVRAGVSFTQPVLDTVLLSAILFGLTAEHSLDAIAARLGVRMAPGARHTGPGDAEATARIFLKMLPLLRQAGFATLGQTLGEFRRYRRLLRSVDR